MPRTTIRSEDVTDAQIKTADMAVDPTNASNLSSGDVPLAQLGNVPPSDTSGLEDDIALLGFKVAVNGSLAKYNLVDQTVDAFQDSSGIDAAASTNELRNAANYVSGGVFSAATGGTITTYTKGNNYYRVHTFTSSGTFGAPSTGIVDILAVGGGGAGGYRGSTSPSQNGTGGGGAGGFTYHLGRTVATGNHAITVGLGMPGAQNTTAGTGGYSQFGTVTPTALGGAKYSAGGGSGNGANYNNSPGKNDGTLNQGNPGGVGNTNGAHVSGGGGGGSAAAGAQGPVNVGGNGGAGYEEGKASAYQTVYDWKLADGKMVEFNIDGTGNFYAGGGGGAGNDGGGTGGAGGGGPGRQTGTGADGTDGTGGGGGAGGANYIAGSGGDGIVIVRYGDAADPNPAFLAPQDLTLVSTATTADAQPTKGDLVMTYSNGIGTATIPTDLKAYISRDNGTTYTEFPLTSQGVSGGHTILTSHDLDITGQPAGTSMRYKITTHNQDATKSTRIQGVSIGWS